MTSRFFIAILHNSDRDMPHERIMYTLPVVDMYLDDRRKVDMHAGFLLAGSANKKLIRRWDSERELS